MFKKKINYNITSIDIYNISQALSGNSHLLNIEENRVSTGRSKFLAEYSPY